MVQRLCPCKRYLSSYQPPVISHAKRTQTRRTMAALLRAYVLTVNMLTCGNDQGGGVTSLVYCCAFLVHSPGFGTFFGKASLPSCAHAAVEIGVLFEIARGPEAQTWQHRIINSLVGKQLPYINPRCILCFLLKV